MENYLANMTLSIGFLAIASFGCAIGQGILVNGVSNAVARQPSLLGSMQAFLFVGLGFIEALAIYCLIISFMMFGKLPETEAVMELLTKMKCCHI